MNRARLIEAFVGYASLVVAGIGGGMCASGIAFGAIPLALGAACYAAWMISLEW